MISQSEVESINRYLLEATGTLDNIQRTFIKKFESEPNPYPYFYQGLCDNIFTKGQRLLTIYLLYNSELRSCLQDIYNFTLNDFERKFIQDPQIYAAITIKTLLEEQDKFTSNDRPISKDYSNNQIAQNKMRNCISLNNNNPPQKLRQNTNIDFIQQQNGFEIEYLRPIPNVVQNRFDWIDLNDISYAIWDYSLQINSDKLSQIKEIIQKAHNEQISEYELQLFQEYLKKDNYNFLKNNGLINFNLGEIIEKNLNLAFFLFSKYFPNPEFLELMDNLVQMDVLQILINQILQNRIILFEFKRNLLLNNNSQWLRANVHDRLIISHSLGVFKLLYQLLHSILSKHQRKRLTSKNDQVFYHFSKALDQQETIQDIRLSHRTLSIFDRIFKYRRDFKSVQINKE